MESVEIKRLVKQYGRDKIPIAKTRKRMFVCICQAKARKKDMHPMFTTNVDKMMPMDPYEDKDENRCDFCGPACTNMLYVFRGYPRAYEDVEGQKKEDLADAT